MSQPPPHGSGKPPAPPPPDIPSAADERPTVKVPTVSLGPRPSSASVPAAPPAARPPAPPPGARPLPGIPPVMSPVRTTSPGLPAVPPLTPVPPPPPGAAAPPRPRIPPQSSASLPAVPQIIPAPPARASGVSPVRPPPPPPGAATPPPPPPMPSIAPLVPSVAPSVAPAVAAPPPPPAPPAAPADPLDELAARSARLDQMDYFEILRLERTAAPADIKKAFYRESRAYHPDRFFHLQDKAIKERVNEFYKRVTESYYVLRDDAKRRQYTADIAGPERAQKLRFTESSESETRAATKRQVEEQIGSNPKGRQFYQTGAADADAGRWASAERNLKMALTYEPANARYKEKLAEVQKVLLEESRKQGDTFKIR